ncbi:hypothetical protein F5B22DRAFT_311026 [Xylaria bambusicola]|uniref:uncharacterized protein n=1 Tax=Xylaria bambusicola TaxID=326684 RepID=UPI0020089362|nr:uncharacterized protein F5B22DRAFT_311026 [Xylaria bambusicola]KAI0509685.1 hypothetical protein F5B22DRAFT_311026 [Xylaria bambusicola]
MATTMQQRRSHKKSRRGCLNCKKWHTKCDESGPPCNNCLLRKANCEYAWQKGLVQARKSPSSQTSDDGSLSEPCGLVMKESRRMLELELMHFWSTETYKGLCSVPEDHHYMQFVVPQEALRYDFLLNGIFVAAALQRSTMVQEPEARGYYNIAMELYDRASKSFRIHLDRMDPTTHHVLYIYSSMTAFINIAFSQCNYMEGNELNTLSTVAVAFDLLNGSVNIAKTDFQGLLDSPVPLRAYLNYGLASAVALHPDTRTALARLDNLNEQYHSSRHHRLTPLASDEMSVATTPASDTLSTASTTSATSNTPWKVAVALLQHCFAEEQRAILRGFCFVFPGGAGPDFTAAVKVSDPMALLILMHWAVLIERAGNDFWWARGLGKRLTIGTWKAMQLCPPRSPSPALLTPQWGESISWVCGQLGLPEFVHT